jgi:zinc transport system permease protein
MTALLNDFLVRALLAGVGVALVAGPLGCFIVWRRLAYVGDTLAHAALLGVALGLLFSLNLSLAVFLVCAVVAWGLVWLHGRGTLTSDTLLGIMAHGTLAIGLVILYGTPSARVNLLSTLLGDILAVGRQDLAIIWGGGVLILLGLAWIWKSLLATTISLEIAAAEGQSPQRARLIFMLLTAMVIALAMQVVGVLLISALLIIPAAAARRISTSPESMALGASLIGVLSVIGGLLASYHWDLPAGPAIVTTSLGLFCLSALLPRRQ